MKLIDLQKKINSFPKTKLLLGPMPIVRANNLSAETNVDIYIKRDDLTGLALGGNKTRKLEFLIGEALNKGYDTVITVGAVHSNHALQTAAAAKKMGLDAVLVLRGKEEFKGNLLMDKFLDPDIIFLDVKTSSQLEEHMEQVAADLRKKGKKPMAIPTGGSNPIGALGYFNAVLEIVGQCSKQDLDFDYIVSPTCSGGTQSGILLAYKLVDPKVKVLGIDVGDSRDEVIDDVAAIVKTTANLLGINENIITRQDVASSTVGGYGFDGYGSINREVIQLIKKVAINEGLYLDPVYTGKGFYGLMDMIKEHVIPEGSRVLFIHTGGLGGIFQYEDIISKYII